jgi:hypothetical protein
MRKIMSQESKGWKDFWKTISLPMKILLISLDVGILLAVLYYFVFL